MSDDLNTKEEPTHYGMTTANFRDLCAIVGEIPSKFAYRAMMILAGAQGFHAAQAPSEPAE